MSKSSPTATEKSGIQSIRRNQSYISDDPLLKPAEAAIERGQALGLQYRGRQREVSIKRAGVSQNLGIKARKSKSWIEIRRYDDLALQLSPPRQGVRGQKSVAIQLRPRGAIRATPIQSHAGRGDPAVLRRKTVVGASPITFHDDCAT